MISAERNLWIMNENSKKCPHCEAGRQTQRGVDEKKKLVNRLSRIEGQIRGIKNMVENDSYCPEIMLQVSAVNAALNSFNKVLMENHLKGCVANDLLDGREDTMDELIVVLQKLMK